MCKVTRRVFHCYKMGYCTFILCMILFLSRFSGARQDEFGICDKVLNAISSGLSSGPDTPSPIDINFCQNEIEPHGTEDCNFNATQCENSCEFVGYEMNPIGCQISCECNTNGFLEEDIRFDEKDLPVIRKVYSEFPENVTKNISMDETSQRVKRSIVDSNVTDHKQQQKQGNCSTGTLRCENTCGIVGFKTDSGGCQTNCDCNKSGFVEADIRYEETDVSMVQKTYSDIPDGAEEAGSVGLKIWNQRQIHGKFKVPYVLSRTLNQKAKTAITGAMRAYHEQTCIEFVPRHNETDYINFVQIGGCWSFVGRRGGRQNISIGYGCEWKGVVQHELMHALGFWHQQSRPDRDQHVTVKWENVVPGKEHNFRKRSTVNSFGSSYDLRSLMHYSGFAFSKNLKPTIVVKTTNAPISSQRSDFTEEDRRQINSLYRCYSSIEKSNETQTTVTTADKIVSWSDWESWESCSVICGSGMQIRRRNCLRSTGLPAVVGCTGYDTDWKTCNSGACAPTALAQSCSIWGQWKNWEGCSKSCGTGYQWRYRQCPGGVFRCVGSGWQGRKCNTQSCNTKNYTFSSTKLWKSSMKICTFGSLYSGDFNGDRKQDLLCYYSDTWATVFFSSPTATYGDRNWSGWTAACKLFERPGQIVIFDWNADGADDLICYDSSTGVVAASFSSKTGFKDEIDWKQKLENICDDDQSILFVQDVDGDKLPDLVCRNKLGYVSVLRSTFE